MWIERRGERFIVRWREPGTAKRRSRSFATIEDAQAFLASPTGAERGNSLKEISLADFIDRVLRDDWNLRGSSLYGYRRTLERHISHRIGRRPLEEVSTQELRDFFGSLDLGMAGKAGVYRLLAKAFNRAVRENVLERSPLKSIARPKAVAKEIVPLSPEQVSALASAADPRYRVAILLAGFAGLRAGEIGGLRVQDVDFARLNLRVSRAVRTEGGKRVVGEVKTPAGRRQVALPAFLVAELIWHIGRFPPAPDGRIFSTYEGGLVCHVVLLKRLKAAARSAGIPAPRFHTLRHSAAALMIALGAHPKVIQAQLGHANISVTLDIYGHLFPSLAEETAARIDALVRGEPERELRASESPPVTPLAGRSLGLRANAASD
jgi:integrase